MAFPPTLVCQLNQCSLGRRVCVESESGHAADRGADSHTPCNMDPKGCWEDRCMCFHRQCRYQEAEAPNENHPAM